ncbi:hypothetical protein [Novosphingobium gossypii]|uniref:hypothetical protein n=1 Tax=Novosphingobium gossypii TaxID=1604774 RepID=UPI003D251F4F
MIFRTNFSERRKGPIGVVRGFAFAVFNILREGMEARAGAVRGGTGAIGSGQRKG